MKRMLLFSEYFCNLPLLSLAYTIDLLKTWRRQATTSTVFVFTICISFRTPSRVNHSLPIITPPMPTKRTSVTITISVMLTSNSIRVSPLSLRFKQFSFIFPFTFSFCFAKRPISNDRSLFAPGKCECDPWGCSA